MKSTLLVCFAFLALAPACGGDVNSSTSGTGTTTSAATTGSGGGDATTTGVGGGSATTTGAGGATTTTGAGGGDAGPWTALTAPIPPIPKMNLGGMNLDAGSEVLEAVPVPQSLTCATLTTTDFGCSVTGFSVVFPPGQLKAGDFDLATLVAAHFEWLGTCADGGGGLFKVIQGKLSVTHLDASSVEGTVSGAVEQAPGSMQMLPTFSFKGPRCGP